MHVHERHGPRAGRLDVERAWAASILVLGVLLFTWPFLRTPLLDIGRTYAHLLVGWALIVAALFAMSRALRPRDRERGGGDD
jgi:hypothetical protein